jgi:hypothetical protein
MDQSLDEIRQGYRQIDLVFPFEAAEIDLKVPGVESIETKGRHVRVLSSGNTDEIVAYARAFRASDVDVVAIGLREIFLRTVKGNSHALV